MSADLPIGIFDSGIGGLTVAQAIAEALPHESLVYFGDTAHLPYGDKSTAAIQAYSVKICDVLLRQRCKLIVIACNSASAAAAELVREYVGSKARVLNVIDPLVHLVGAQYANQTVGLIATRQTVSSNVYRKKLDELNVGIQLRALATPLLAPMIEDGFHDSSVSDEVIRSYLSQPALDGITALLLGCTHYPLIRGAIDAFYGGRVAVLDGGRVLAEEVRGALQELHLLADGAFPPRHHFYVSDFTRSFEESTRLFFRRPVQLEHYRLWE